MVPALLAAWLEPARAQHDEDEQLLMPGFEPSWIAPAGPLGKAGDYLLEAQLAAHFFFLNGLGDAAFLTSGGVRWTVAFSLLVHLRMEDSFSSPIHTPGIHPRIIQVRRYSLTVHPSTFTLWAIGGSIDHYSDGQSGCIYRGVKPVTDPASGKTTCDDSKPAGTLFNTIDGDFSTDFFELNLYGRHAWLYAPWDARAKYGLDGQLRLQLHGGRHLPGALGAAQALEWGHVRTQITLGGEDHWAPSSPCWCWLKGTSRIELETTLAFWRPHREWTPAAEGYIQISHTLDAANGVGGFVRLHLGQDDYTINLQDTQPYLLAGVRWEVGRLNGLEYEPHCRGDHCPPVTLPPAPVCQ